MLETSLDYLIEQLKVPWNDDWGPS